jgi:hypothetical protein
MECPGNANAPKPEEQDWHAIADREAAKVIARASELTGDLPGTYSVLQAFMATAWLEGCKYGMQLGRDELEGKL